MDFEEWVRVNDSDGFWVTLGKDFLAGGSGFARSLANVWYYALIGAVLVVVLDGSSFSVTLSVVSVSGAELTPPRGGVLAWVVAAIYDELKNVNTDVR